MAKISIQFLGAAKTVTGSKFLITTPEKGILIDCGLFQGLKELRELNWSEFPVDISTIDLVLLTHGHLDHTGYLPRLVKKGFKGSIIATSPTLKIAEIVVRDSAKINEEEAEKINEEGYSKHQPALPLYNQKEAEQTLSQFVSKELDIWIPITKNLRYRFRYNGHIIGATFIELEVYGKILVFSGDVGRPNDLLLFPPKKPERAEYLFLESTYGDKLHSTESIEKKLIELITRTAKDGGTLIIPSFAIERMQLITYILWKLQQENEGNLLPVFIDSPMGLNVLAVFEHFTKWHKVPIHEWYTIRNNMDIITSYEDTWKTIDDPRPKIVIAGSGMVTGGRVLTYLQQLIDNPTTRVLLVGYQAEGTRGRQLLEGAHEIKIYNKYYDVKAQIHHIESLSAHADQKELLDWIKDFKNIPEKVFLIHGEPTAMDAFRVKLQTELGWNIHMPHLNEIIEIIV